MANNDFPQKIVLQNILIKNLSDESTLLYGRFVGNVQLKREAIIFAPDAEFITDTYFNSLSIGKWIRYCSIENLGLQIRFCGTFKIQIIHAYENNDKIIKKIIFEKVLFSESITENVINIPVCKEGIVYFKLISRGKSSCLNRACYITTVQNIRDVKIALNICTYKREAYLLRNIELIKRHFLRNSDSVLYKSIEVFITDNGRTLDISALEEEKIHVVHNRNYGGTGGFARGMQEIEKLKEKLGITHMIFMDDDVQIEPESIYRTYIMLCLLRDDYEESFIAGAMLRLDKLYTQHENGAVWNNGKCKFCGRGLDLREFNNIITNEKECKKDYAAWWYCCVPISVIRKDNYPIPLFIHEDDVEYSLRNANSIITINGIAIWHEASEHRRASSNEYYNLRNMFIVNALYSESYSPWKAKKQVFTAMMVAALRYRYKDMHLIQMAVEDFCRGPEWLMQVEAEDYHKKVIEKGYFFQNVSEYLVNPNIHLHYEENPNDGYKARIKNAKTLRQICKCIIQIVSLNGYFIPMDKSVNAYYMNVHPVQLYRKGTVILYDNKDNKGIIVKRSLKQLFVMVKLLLKEMIIIDLKYRKSCLMYKSSFNELASVRYWEYVQRDSERTKK